MLPIPTPPGAPTARNWLPWQSGADVGNGDGPSVGGVYAAAGRLTNGCTCFSQSVGGAVAVPGPAQEVSHSPASARKHSFARTLPDITECGPRSSDESRSGRHISSGRSCQQPYRLIEYVSDLAQESCQP